MRPRLGHIDKEYAARLRLLRGDGNGKINFNTASRDDSGLSPDIGDGYGNARLLTPINLEPLNGGPFSFVSG